MKRARNQTVHALRGLTWNPKTNLYEITEDEITYSMPLESTRLLKHAFSNSVRITEVSQWYSELSKEEKSKVVRTGRLPIVGDDFFS